VIDPSAFHLLLLAVTGWLDCREREAMAYLIEENRLLRRQLGSLTKDSTEVAVVLNWVAS